MGQTHDRANLYSAPSNLPEFDISWLENCSIPQSMQFIIDILPDIRNLTYAWPRNVVMQVLDVGASSGAGTNLLATLYKGAFFGFPMKVDALDISSSYKLYADHLFPNINYIVDDLFAIGPNRTWDMIICSHTIEHFTNPIPFILELQRRARHWVLCYAPYKETDLIPGHLISIDDDLIWQFSPIHKRIIPSPAWKSPNDPLSLCVCFALAGSTVAKSI